MRTREIVNTPEEKQEAKAKVETENLASTPFEELNKGKYSPLFDSRPIDKPEVDMSLQKPIAPAASEDEWPEAEVSTNLGPNWVRQLPPSKCVPYEFSTVFVRPLEWPDLGLIHASMANKSFTTLVDAINNCLSVDARDLTPSDFTFYMYWIRQNSYPQLPIKFPYRTRYGHDLQVSVRQSDLEIVELDMTKAEYAEWQEKDICFPTVRDMELLFNESVEKEKRFLLDYAQYIKYVPANNDYRDYAASKVDILSKKGLAYYSVIEEFSKKIEHGVIETVTVTDNQFDPNEAAEFFEEEAKNIMATLEILKDDDDFAATVTRTLAIANEMLEEANRIKEALAAGETVLPEKEVVAININATDFFPSV